MQNTIHASFENAADGVRAAESLLSHGLLPGDISLILPDAKVTQHSGNTGTLADIRSPHLSKAVKPDSTRRATNAPVGPCLPRPPQLPALPEPSKSRYYSHEAVMAPAGRGYTYDVLGAVIPDSAPRNKGASRGADRRAEKSGAVLGTEEGLGLGLGLGLLTAMCVPGLGMVAGAGALVAGLLAAGAAAGGVGGGIYGWLIGGGVDHESAHLMSHHLNSGWSTISVSVTDSMTEQEICDIIGDFGGRLMIK